MELCGVVDVLLGVVLVFVAISLARTAEILRGVGGPQTQAKLDQIIQQENSQMSLGQDILDKITARNTTIDSIKELLDAWVANNSISAEQRDAINAAFDSESAKLGALEAALQPAPPTP